MMRKVLLVDTNFSSAPIYNCLIQSGCEVFVVGGNPNDFLAKTAKNYINLDYSNVDRTREIVEKMNIDYVVPGCNDLSYQVCAEINSKGNYYGLDTLETAETINNKYKFRAFATQIGLPVPQVITTEQAGEIWPLIVKPADAYSGRGLTVVQKSAQQELQSAIDRAKEFSRLKTVIVEKYVEGQLYSHSAFIANGDIYADFIVEEYSTANPFVVDTSRVVYDFPGKMLGHIRDCITLMVSKLELVDGLIHTQFIKKGNSFWLIEITRRCPGDLYSQLIELSTSYKYAETYARPFVKQKLSFGKNTLKQSWVMRHTISQPTEGVLGSIQFNFPILIEKMVPLSLAGDMIKVSPFGRIALIFLRSNSEKEFLALYQKTLNRSLYTIKENH
jgi:predicted ATP-grasp superfamily ATP-dependent carboligase